MTKKHKLDKTTLSKLAGLLPATSDFMIDFTPDDYKDIPDDFKPVFMLKPWTANQVKEIAKFLQKSGEDESYMMNKVKAQIIGWSNLIDLSTGDDLPFDPNHIDKLPQKIINSITFEIMRISGINA